MLLKKHDIYNTWVPLCFALLVIFLLITSFKVTQVQKESKPIINEYDPMIVIHEPFENDVYKSEKGLNLSVTVENNVDIKNIDITIINRETLDTVYHFFDNPGEEYIYTLNKYVDLQNEENSDLLLKVSSWDKKFPESKVSREVGFSVK